MIPPPAPPLTPRGPGSASSVLAGFPQLSPPVSAAGAAVTIILRDGATDLEILLIERAVRADDIGSGQVALPGGHVEVTDGSLAETALRELEEEVGIPRTDVAASLRFVRVEPARRFGVTVGVFAAELSEVSHGPVSRNPAEVAHVFWLPRGALESDQPIDVPTPSGSLRTPATCYAGHVLWGFTRRVLRNFFDLPTGEEFGTASFASSPPPADPDSSDTRRSHAG